MTLDVSGRFFIVQAIGSWDFDDTMEQAQYQEKPQEKLQFQPMLKTWGCNMICLISTTWVSLSQHGKYIMLLLFSFHPATIKAEKGSSTRIKMLHAFPQCFVHMKQALKQQWMTHFGAYILSPSLLDSLQRICLSSPSCAISVQEMEERSARYPLVSLMFCYEVAQKNTFTFLGVFGEG
jgi:hypothetical protein